MYLGKEAIDVVGEHPINWFVPYNQDNKFLKKNQENNFVQLNSIAYWLFLLNVTLS